MKDIYKAVDSGVEKVIEDFRKQPRFYFTEEDVRWRLIKEIEEELTVQGAQHIGFLKGVTSALHAEYPTPFRCSMREYPFRLEPPDSKGRRGHFDIAVLNASAAAQYDFEVLRSQNYDVVREKLLRGGMPIPFLDTVIEIKLFRDFAHPNRTGSVRQQAEDAVQAVSKVAATLEAQTGYYPKPFAKRGLVLLFDNSDLVCAGDAKVAHGKFQEMFSELAHWDLLPNTLSCVRVIPQGRENYQGHKYQSSNVSRPEVHGCFGG